MIPTDVADPGQVEAAAAKVEAELGPIDIWVNNAMTSVFSPIKQMTADEFKRVTDVTYLGYVHGSLSALKRMLPRNRGVIVHVGSALAYRSIPLQAAYCAAKHAVLGFHAALRTELLHDRSECADHDGPNAGAQHAPVWLGKKQVTAQSSTRSANLSA